MKNGQCPRCGLSSIYTKPNGILRVVTNPPCGVYIEGLSKITFPTNLEIYICSNCGFFEEYVADPTKLSKIAEKWDKVG